MKAIYEAARKYLVVVVVLFAIAGVPMAEAFVAQAGPVTIARIRTGWAADAFAIETNQAVINPAGCSTPDGYMSESSHPGYKTYYAVVLMAFSSGRPVTVIVSSTECHSGRPKIMGVYVAQ